MLTHRALLANLDQLMRVTDPAPMLPDDVVLIVLPMFHIYALNAALGLVARCGATAVISDRFDPELSLRLVQDHNVTNIAGAPPMYIGWSAIPGFATRMESVRMLASGASPLLPRGVPTVRLRRADDLGGLRDDRSRAGHHFCDRHGCLQARKCGPSAPRRGNEADRRSRATKLKRAIQERSSSADRTFSGTGPTVPKVRTPMAGSRLATSRLPTTMATCGWSTGAETSSS